MGTMRARWSAWSCHAVGAVACSCLQAREGAPPAQWYITRWLGIGSSEATGKLVCDGGRQGLPGDAPVAQHMGLCRRANVALTVEVRGQCIKHDGMNKSFGHQASVLRSLLFRSAKFQCVPVRHTWSWICCSSRSANALDFVVMYEGREHVKCCM
jgi:hypothetical protein